MAGHSQFKNIMHRKGAQDARKAKTFTKIIKEITIAVRVGGIDPKFNPRLRSAIAAAREVNLPKDKIEAVLKRAEASDNADNYEYVRYEGYGPAGVAFIVESITDNKNRTVGEVRSIFHKHGGTLGETGSVNYMFEHVGVIVFDNHNIANLEHILGNAIDAGASDCIAENCNYEVTCEFEKFHNVKEKLEDKYGKSKSAQIVWKPMTMVKLDLENARKTLTLMIALEDCEDVHDVSCNADISKEIMEKLNE